MKLNFSISSLQRCLPSIAAAIRSLLMRQDFRSRLQYSEKSTSSRKSCAILAGTEPTCSGFSLEPQGRTRSASAAPGEFGKRVTKRIFTPAEAAARIVQEAFPDREIIPLDASIIVRQHGSIHCITMQIPK